jgi:hypothetical protein
MAGAQEKFSAASVNAANADLNAERAEDPQFADFSKPEYLDYAEKLAIYEARSDTEPLADRRARDHGETFEDADFTREAGYTGVSEEQQTSRGE